MKNLPDTLDGWLHYCEHLHPHTIEMGLDRVALVKERLGLHLDCPVITVAGTNGKGSTCAMIEAVALQAGYRPGVYTSPHLVHFEERCRIHGETVKPEELLPHFEAVERARTEGGEVQLTYFEFTTLAILRLISLARVDVAVLEVGMGGRLDAVNVIDADCAVITMIDVDHAEFLGPDRESIGREKAGIMRPGRPVVVCDPVPPESVIEHAKAIGARLWRFGTDFNYSGDKLQWSWAGRGRRYAGMSYPALRGANQLFNASGALAALEAIREKLPISAQAVRAGLALVELPGRFEVAPGQPVVVLDVAHNPHAVATLAASMSTMGHFRLTHAVFGAMADKDITGIFEKIGPLIDRWYFTDLPTPRAETAAHLQERWERFHAQQEALQTPPAVVQDDAPRMDLAEAVKQQDDKPHLSVTRSRRGSSGEGGGGRRIVKSEVFADPQTALDAAIAASRLTDRIVVFGSFYTVGGILKNGMPQMHGKHFDL
ncbi:MAG: bifunctional tetrahydrofolate synthase/dihydrofolate synthase [Comamonas sp.]